MITIPRLLILALGALFSAYHIVLGIYALGVPATPWPSLVAMALYAVATLISLWPSSPTQMPLWLGGFTLATVIALPLLVTSQLDPHADNGYATWYVAAVGTLMTIAAARRRLAVAWAGVAFLALHTVIWAGPGALGGIGVVGSIVWVAVAHMLGLQLAKAGRDANHFLRAEREATEWQAAQDAHLYERRFRLAQTNRIAAPMLRRISDLGGDLTDGQRQECRNLEAAIRDEIRGRMLLNDRVRAAVRAARGQGAIVTLLDEGGIDELCDEERGRVLDTLAEAIQGSAANKIIARTVSDGSETAVTVVGLRLSDGGSASALGQEELDDEVELWLEIPRRA
ncbi:hypothetical protein [Microterricola viridarii]|uniref:Uncharacterized protein n=1 Tax=Microterricola viridarii TaxID=412690 RepID=A0A0Y0PCF4_9MICO|nr:hypothetical protein [Microterricola viridarii]AMB60277.1 hypothetical protein AWU67_01855 [Microterricola viridarii]